MKVLIDVEYGFQTWVWEPKVETEEELRLLWSKHRPTSCCDSVTELPGTTTRIWDEIGPSVDTADFVAQWHEEDDSHLIKVTRKGFSA